MFVAAAGGLLAIALALVLWGLLRPLKAAPQEGVRGETVKALYRDRLAELNAEAEAGQVAADDRAAMEAELGAVLLDDFDERAPETARGASLAPTWLAATLALTAAVALGSYLSVGDPGADELIGARAVLSLDPHNDRAALEGWQERLAARVKARPGESESWYLLGHTQLLGGEYARAAESFAVAHAQVGPDPGLDMAWLQARYLAAQGAVDPITREIAGRVLERDPSQPLVLELFAVDAFREGRFKDAVGFLNRALSAPVGPRQRNALEEGLKEARRQLGDLAPSLDVQVAAGSTTPQGATLFVIARPAGGGMPFAVVRRPAASFPASVRLDDAVSMNPALGLSQAGEVEVVVRLSLSGAPMAHPGDWEWRSEVINLQELEAPLLVEATLEPPEPTDA